MKRILPVILSLSTIFCLFSCLIIPNRYYVKSETPVITNVDFNYEAQGNFKLYKGESDETANPPFKNLNDNNHNNVYVQYLTRPRNTNPQRNCVIRDSNTTDGKPVYLKYGTKYTITLDYKNVYTTADYTIALRWCVDPYNTQNFTVTDGYYTNLETVSASTSEGAWSQVKAEITPTKNTALSPVLVAYSGTTKSGQKIYFDNIKIVEGTESDVEGTEINFDEEIKGDYSYFKGESNQTTDPAFINLNDGKHDNVYVQRLTRPKNTNPQRNYVLRDSNSKDAKPLSLKFGKQYTIILEYKNVSTVNDYTIALRWCVDPYNTQDFTVADGYYTDIKSVKASTTEQGWSKISAVITPTKSTALSPALVAYTKEGTKGGQKIYFDNIRVVEGIVQVSKSTKIDFDKEATGEYSYYKAEDDQTKYPVFTDLNDEQHKNVYAVYLTRPTTQRPHRAYALRDSNSETNSPLQLDYGTTYNINMKCRADKISKSFIVGIAWLSDPVDVKGNLGLDSSCTDLKLISKLTAKNGWIDISGQITPSSEKYSYPVLVAYSSQLNNKTEIIYFDDIEVNESDSEDKNNTYTDNTQINFDTESQSKFYSAENSNVTYKLLDDDNKNILDTKTDYKNAALIDRITNSLSTLGPSSVSNVRCIGIANAEGNDYANFKTGGLLDVKVDINVEGCTEEQFYVGIAFADGEMYGAGRIGEYKTGGGLLAITNDRKLIDVGEVNTSVKGWQTISSTIAVPNHTFNETAWLVLYRKEGFTAMYSTGQEIYVDNISVKSSGDANCISFESNGGNSMNKIYFVSGSDSYSLDKCKKTGYQFGGWYYDSELKNEYLCTSKMPDKGFKLYAKWNDFSNLSPIALKTGFESKDYKDGNIPYTNKSFDGEISKNNVTDKVNAFSSTVHINDKEGAYEGSNYLEIDNRLQDGSSKSSSVALLNADGSNFYVVKGCRYNLNCVVNAVMSRFGSVNSELRLVISGFTPESGLTNSNSDEIDIIKFQANEFANEEVLVRNMWGVHNSFFEAPDSGYVYFTLINTDRPISAVKIDSLSITPMNEKPITKVTYKTDDGKKTYGSQFGYSDEKIKENYLADVHNGYVFDGWKKQDGSLFTFDEFPDEDLTIFASYKTSDYSNGKDTVNWDKTITSGFEGSNKLQNFYNDQKNVRISQVKDTGVVLNDPDNAHSGNGYYKFNKSKSTCNLKVFADNTPDNYLWLDAKSEYLVTYYVKVLDMSDAYRIDFRTGTFSTVDSVESMNVADTYMHKFSDEKQKWIKVSHRITTNDEKTILGIAVSGTYVSCIVDDITVDKLGIKTVNFVSNGGTAVEKMEAISMSYAVEPEYPQKEGFVFDGWYTDTALKNKFDFNTTMIINNLTLYAKWSKEVPENLEENDTVVPEKKTKTVYSTEYKEKTVENDLSEYGLDKTPEIKESDKVSSSKNKVVKKEVTEKSNIWVIILIISIVFVCGICIAVIIILKKKKNINKK